jgi:glycosyltransferase involved in cell wall biosynthesis
LKREKKVSFNFLVNGDIFCNNITGIERYTLEILTHLDKLINRGLIAVVIPKNIKSIPKFSNISIIKYHYNVKSFPVWQQLFFPLIAKKYKALPIDFGNSCSLIYPGITFLHDIYCEIYPADFSTPREKIECLYFRLMYRIIKYRAKYIITVSEFIKTQLINTLKFKKNRIGVISNGWEHFANFIPDFDIFKKFEFLIDNNFYFTVGSLSKRKNIIWIYKYAKKHPRDLFLISGKNLKEKLSLNSNKINNIYLCGYLTDSEVKALMMKCKAFIFPSYYEGFGIPPLEALSVDAKVIVSDSSCLKEIFKNVVHYINPFDSNVNLDKLINEEVDMPDAILNKYKYEKSAHQLLEVVNAYRHH